MKRFLFISVVLFVSFGLSAQQLNPDWLNDFSRKKAEEYKQKKEEAIRFAEEHDLLVKQVLPDGRILEIQEVVNGIPQYYIVNNAGAAKTARVDKLYPGGSLGLNLTGSGFTQIGLWDGGKIRDSHDELKGRISFGDGVSSDPLSNHATHVAGTILATGVDPNAKGMAYEAELTSYEWNNDVSEMSAAAAAGLKISNHSYQYIRGYYWDASYGWLWYGDPVVDDMEDYLFGFYNETAKSWDEVAYNAPYYLIVKSVGIDRGDGYQVAGGGNPEKDGGDDGFDCIPTVSTAKNVITVGAVHEVLDYTDPDDVIMTYYSDWGPTDDGRIKPDIVAKGYQTYSSGAASDNDYYYGDGTSMATASITGTLVLLQQHYENTHGTSMKSATLKGLAINTADEAGPYPGPDYMFGWGLINAERAARLITDDTAGLNCIDELSLSNGSTYTRNITVGKKPVKVTIVWTDPAGTPVAPQLNPSTPMLVNDLDLKVTDGSTTYYPWKLNRLHPDHPATATGENDVDNVETVYIENPSSTTMTITVDHDGSLSSTQDFSLIIQGLDEYGSIPGECATLIYPTDGATNVPLSIVIRWSEVSDATSYDVYFGTDPAATNILNGVNQGETYLNQCLDPATTYYLKVYPRNNQGARTSCTTWSFTTVSATAVSLPYSENFDGVTIPNLPTGWEQESTLDDFDWISNSGTTPTSNTGPDDDVTGGGNYLYTEASSPNSPGKRAIVYTPYFDLNSLAYPQLTFYYHMYGAQMGVLNVQIFYQGKWETLLYRSGPQQSAGSDPWIEVTVDLTPYKDCSYQRIRFFGSTSDYLSDMAIDGFGISNATPMSLSTVTTVQGPTTSVAPSETKKEIISVQIVASGFANALSATKFEFNTQGTVEPGDIENARLYFTDTSNVFSTDNQVGSTVAAPNGDFSFDLDDLEGKLLGDTNFFWLTYDIASDANGCYYVDAVCNSVTISGTSYTPSVTDPSGERQILNWLFIDDFETDKGWILTGEFERDIPQGLGGNSYNYSDPYTAYSGDYVLGTDITGLGANLGDYENNLGDREYTAVSPTIDCLGDSNIHISFKRWLNVEGSNYDHVYVDVWDGSNWVEKYVNPTSAIQSNKWVTVDIDVSAEADGNSNFKVRFALGSTDGTVVLSGWNIDDFVVYSTNSCEGIPGLWTGNAASTDWNTVGNWDNLNVPDCTINVIIPNRAYQPVVDKTTSCKNINICDGGVLTCGTSGNMSVFGTLYIGEGTSGTFNMQGGTVNINGDLCSKEGSNVNISGGTISFVNWKRCNNYTFAKGNIHLSGGTLNASGSVYYSLSDLSGIMDGPFEFNVAGSFYINDVNWLTVTDGTINMTGSGTHYFIPSNVVYNAIGFNVVLKGGGTYYFQRSTGSHGWDVKGNLSLTNGTLHTTNSGYNNSYFKVSGDLSVGDNGTFNHGAFTSYIGGKLNIGNGTGGLFSIDPAANCNIGITPPAANIFIPKEEEIVFPEETLEQGSNE